MKTALSAFLAPQKTLPRTTCSLQRSPDLQKGGSQGHLTEVSMRCPCQIPW